MNLPLLFWPLCFTAFSSQNTIVKGKKTAFCFYETFIMLWKLFLLLNGCQCCIRHCHFHRTLFSLQGEKGLPGLNGKQGSRVWSLNLLKPFPPVNSEILVSWQILIPPFSYVLLCVCACTHVFLSVLYVCCAIKCVFYLNLNLNFYYADYESNWR